MAEYFAAAFRFVSGRLAVALAHPFFLPSMAVCIASTMLVEYLKRLRKQGRQDTTLEK